MTRIEFTSRWDQGIGKSARIKIVRALQKQEPIAVLTPFGAIEGRADLRGFHETTLRGIRNVKLACIDFSFCNLHSVRMTSCILKNLKFNSASMRDFVDEGNRFDTCQFGDISFSGAGFGVKRSQFVNCTFTKCDFSRLRFGQVEFDNCHFDSCRLKGVDFGASSFVDVTFNGKLEDVWFRGRDPFLAFTQGPTAQSRTNEMIRVSFADAELNDVTFSDNCPLAQVILPQNDGHRLLDRWPERVTTALDVIKDWNNQRAWNYVAAYLPHSKSQSEYIINRNALIDSLGDEVGMQVFDTLTRY